MKYISSFGDSLTYPVNLGVSPSVMWPNVLAQKLKALGCNVSSQNNGKSGITSTTMLTFLGWALRGGGTCDLATVFCGANDPGASISTATTQLNLQSAIRALKYGCYNRINETPNIVATPSALPAGGRLGDRCVVQVDNDATGGLAASDASQLPTITGAGGNDITVWEYRGSLVGVYGWGRVATTATSTLANSPACKMVLVIGMQYQNFSSPGDTLSTPNPAYQTLRTGAQIPAAAAEGVPYVDIYNYFRNRIVAGTDLDMNGAYVQARSWHIADSNQHHNQYGHEILAQAVLQTIQAQSGWITALS